MNDMSDTEKGYILVIDDDPLLTRTIRKILERAGYNVDTADDGYEGIKKAKSGFFHLVLCDVRMPGLDGLMTIQHIQKFQEEAGLGKSGFLVITAYDTDDYRSQAYMLGVTDFIKKPFDLEAFEQVVKYNIEPHLKDIPSSDVSELNVRLSRLIEQIQA